MEELKRKRGRPKKVAAPIVPTPIAPEPQVTMEEIDRTGKDDMKYTTAADSPLQKDFILGTKDMREDVTYVPEVIQVNGETRRVYNPTEYRLRWVAADKVSHWKLAGFSFFPYAPIFSGSGLYERDQDGHILQGDTRLMYAPIRAWLALKERIQKKKDLYDNVARTEFANTGYKSGIRTFQEHEGGRLEYD